MLTRNGNPILATGVDISTVHALSKTDVNKPWCTDRSIEGAVERGVGHCKQAEIRDMCVICHDVPSAVVCRLSAAGRGRHNYTMAAT